MWRGYIGDTEIRLNENNPFLEMLAAVDGAGPGAGQPVEPAAAEQLVVEQQSFGRFKLPDFWPHAPGIWFARAELRFEVSGVASERQRFAYTVDALPYEALCIVADLVETPPEVTPYTVLKERLLMAHQLTPVEKAAKLMDMPPLGDRRPSQLLADLLQACPPGEQKTAFFRAAFIKRLPAELQVHLSGSESVELKELAQRADQLWATHRRPSPLAALDQHGGGQVAEEETLLAAVQSKAAGKGKQFLKKKKQLITYCYLHHKFGKEARRCDNPEVCMWNQGN
jgi:hypothetical protein